MNKYSNLILIVSLAGALLTGCAGSNEQSADLTLVSENNVVSNIVAAEAETVPNQLEIPEDAVPIYGNDIKDGVYDIDVESSSSMFKITSCKLTVSGGKMTAEMTMGGKGYLYLFMGNGENAADESQFIPFEETAEGVHIFTIPVEALDIGIDCSAFSKNKEKWYDRTLLFHADSLPYDAFSEGVIATVESLEIENGEYTVDVKLEGGSGRASVQSPAKLTVTDGQAYAEIIWSSSNYDYMAVNGEKYYMTNTEGNSTFVIPVTGFDYKMPVSADTTAMSTPYEIEYTLYFDSDTIKQ